MAKYEVRCDECDSRIFQGEAETGVDAVHWGVNCGCCSETEEASIYNCSVITL